MRRALTILLILLVSSAVALLASPPDPWSVSLRLLPILLVAVPSYVMGLREGRVQTPAMATVHATESAAAGSIIAPPYAEGPTSGTVQIEPLAAIGGPCRALFRAKMPGGWLVGSLGNRGQEALTFYPDPDHVWDGNSIG